MVRLTKLASYGFVAALLMGGVGQAETQETIGLIESAAQKVAAVRLKEGNDGALILVAECVRELEKNGSPLRDAEICATYDWVFSLTTISFWSELGVNTAKQSNEYQKDKDQYYRSLGLEMAKKDPAYQMAQAYADRITKMLLSAGRTYNDPEIKEFVALMKEHALPAYGDARYGQTWRKP